MRNHFAGYHETANRSIQAYVPVHVARNTTSCDHHEGKLCSGIHSRIEMALLNCFPWCVLMFLSYPHFGKHPRLADACQSEEYVVSYLNMGTDNKTPKRKDKSSCMK